MDKHYIARALSLRLGKRRVIDSVSLTLRPGEVTALIGPNGAGKSTLLRLLTGFLAADSGEQRIEGKPLSEWSAAALSRRRAVMLQRTQLNANWPVETVIAMGRTPWGAQDDPTLIQRVMAETGCVPAERAAARRRKAPGKGVPPDECSLAQLWHGDGPKGWLFLDEPTSALDLFYQQHLLRLLKRLTRRNELHVCVVLHDLNLAALWADTILLLHQGKLVAQGTPHEVIQQSI